MNMRKKLLAGETVVGTFCALQDPAAIEVLAGTGFDVLCLDAEHSALDRVTIESLIRAADARDAVAFVRVQGNTAELIGGALDSGARGVLVPRINTAEEAAAAVEATRYPPLGSRGAGPGRAAAYGAEMGSYMPVANEEILLAVQIETQEAVANARAIAEVPGVDMVFIGPGDLGVSLRAVASPDQTPAEAAGELRRAIDSVVADARAVDQKIGLFRPNAADVGEWVAEGVTFFLLSSDAFMLAEQAAETAKAAKEAAANASK